MTHRQLVIAFLVDGLGRVKACAGERKIVLALQVGITDQNEEEQLRLGPAKYCDTATASENSATNASRPSWCQSAHAA